MANGKHTYGSDGGGTVSITVPSGVTTNTTVTLQDKNGTVSRLEDNGGRRNYLINGNFDKWDYATSQTTSGYGSDNRWVNVNIGSTKVHSQVACTDTERALFNATYFSRTVVASVSGISNICVKQQYIENITKLAGKTVTLSFWAKADSTKNIAIEFSQVFGTGGTPSAFLSEIGVITLTLTSTWQKFTKTVTLPSIVGKTLGTDGVHTTSTGLYFWFDAGSNFNKRTNSLGQQSGTFDIAQVKLEDGTVATDGWHPYDGEFGSEVQACQRYYEIGFVKSWGIASAAIQSMGHSQGYKVSKRVIPTVSFVNTELTNVTSIISENSLYSLTAYANSIASGTYSYQADYIASAEL